MEDKFQSDRNKIYEKLEYKPQPKDYIGKLPWTVQMQIAATNGKQYVDLVGKLKDYPEYELPVENVEQGVMLDIGCGWGRWLVASARKGYLPIGVDLRVEFCETALNTLNDHKMKGYVVAADLMDLPFKNNIFDLIWSFSVIQHTHKIRLQKCLHEIYRILKFGGITKLEFPNKNGFRNKRGPVIQSEGRKDEFNSWVVRYYSISEYKEIFEDIFGNFSYDVHSFLGIGVLKEDIKYVSFKNKLLCAASLILTSLSKAIPVIKKNADSIYINATKQNAQRTNSSAAGFLTAHAKNPSDNLNVIHLLHCPNTNEKMKVKKGVTDFIFNDCETFKYPVINRIPIMIKSEGIPIG